MDDRAPPSVAPTLLPLRPLGRTGLSVTALAFGDAPLDAARLYLSRRGRR